MFCHLVRAGCCHDSVTEITTSVRMSKTLGNSCSFFFVSKPGGYFPQLSLTSYAASAFYGIAFILFVLAPLL